MKESFHRGVQENNRHGVGSGSSVVLGTLSFIFLFLYFFIFFSARIMEQDEPAFSMGRLTQGK